MEDETFSPMSLDELHDLRRRILHEEGFEPDILTMKRAIQAICVARPLPEQKKPKAAPRTKAKDIDLSDLL